jgi:hypothetical protein
VINKKLFRMGAIAVPVIIAIFIISGCATKKANVWGDPSSGLILQYRMTEGDVLNYEMSSEKVEITDVMGQSMESHTQSSSSLAFLSKGMQDDNLRLEVTIGSMGIDISTPQGDLVPDMSSVVGKSFEMILSPFGKEIDTSAAKSIQYELGPLGNRSVEAGFQAIFPDLAEKPVRIGDSWTSQDTITDESGTMSVTISINGVDTLDGFESVDGMECARVSEKFTGTIKGEGSQAGADLAFDGDVEGTATWFFAYQKGIFVKMKSSFTVEAVVEVSGPQSLSLPTTQETKMEMKLVK